MCATLTQLLFFQSVDIIIFLIFFPCVISDYDQCSDLSVNFNVAVGQSDLQAVILHHVQ